MLLTSLSDTYLLKTILKLTTLKSVRLLPLNPGPGCQVWQHVLSVPRPWRLWRQGTELATSALTSRLSRRMTKHPRPALSNQQNLLQEEESIDSLMEFVLR